MTDFQSLRRARGIFPSASLGIIAAPMLHFQELQYYDTHTEERTQCTG